METTEFMSFPRKCHPEYLKRISYLYAFLPRRRKYRFRMRNPLKSWNFMKTCGIHDFMETCEFHVKSPESNHWCPRLKTSVKRMPFCMVGTPFGCFWGQNGEIHWIPSISAKFHPFWWNLVKIVVFGVSGEGMVPLHEILLQPSVFSSFQVIFSPRSVLFTKFHIF